MDGHATAARFLVGSGPVRLLLDLFFLADEWQLLEVGHAHGDAVAATISGDATER